MIIMFILMALPLLALPVFWLLPMIQAVPVYLVGVLLSLWMFWLMRRNKRYRVVTGREGMIGEEAEIVSKPMSGKGNQYMIRVEGELWTVSSNDDMEPGDKVIITAIEGNTPIVIRKTIDKGE